VESRAAQVEILRFWEEMELLTPADLRRKDAEARDGFPETRLKRSRAGSR